jgi:hypothetical protein
LNQTYAPVLLHPYGLAFVMLLYAGLVGGAVWGAINVTIDYKTSYFIGPNAYLKDYFDKSDKYFVTGLSASFYTDGEHDYYSTKS